jgi:hypothetical protein
VQRLPRRWQTLAALTLATKAALLDVVHDGCATLAWDDGAARPADEHPDTLDPHEPRAAGD